MRVDASAHLGAWPFRGGIEGTVSGLTAAMRNAEVEGALLSPLAPLLHNDPAPANDEFVRQLRGRAHLWAVPMVNPRMSDAAQYVAQLAKLRQVRGVRLVPNFHGYRLEDAGEVVQAAAECGLTVVVQLRMQDERSHLPTFRVPPVPLAEAVDLAATTSARIVAAAAKIADVEHRETAGRIRERRNLWLDTSHLDGLACLRRACKAVGASRLLMGTCWPLFYARSAALKVAEAELSPRDQAAITGGNAVRAFRLPTVG